MSASRSEQTIRRSPTLALAETIERARRDGKDVLSLSTPTFPDGALPDISDLQLGARLTAAEGHPELREAARPALFGRWQLPDHELLIAAGAKAALFSVLRTLLPLQSRVVVIAPAWPSYADIVQLAGHAAVLLETRAEQGFAIVQEDLARVMDSTGAGAIILSNPGNPTGRIHGPAELDVLARAAGRHGAQLVIDESFSHIVFDAAAWTRAVIAANDRLVLINSFSKNFHLQGLRVAAAMVHGRRFANVVACHQTLVSAAPSLSQAVALATLRSEGAQAVASRYRASREIALGIVERAGWTCAPGSGTFYLFPRIADVGRIFARMREAGLFPLDGAAFGGAYREHLRLCYGKPEAEMAEIARRLAAAGIIAGG